MPAISCLALFATSAIARGEFRHCQAAETFTAETLRAPSPVNACRRGVVRGIREDRVAALILRGVPRARRSSQKLGIKREI